MKPEKSQNCVIILHLAHVEYFYTISHFPISTGVNSCISTQKNFGFLKCSSFSSLERENYIIGIERYDWLFNITANCLKCINFHFLPVYIAPNPENVLLRNDQENEF